MWNSPKSQIKQAKDGFSWLRQEGNLQAIAIHQDSRKFLFVFVPRWDIALCTHSNKKTIYSIKSDDKFGLNTYEAGKMRTTKFKDCQTGQWTFYQQCIQAEITGIKHCSSDILILPTSSWITTSDDCRNWFPTSSRLFDPTRKCSLFTLS